MKTKRKVLSKRQRFEVFKRDSFTCQYCGQSAPDVVLNADHIIPVSKGGTDKVTNLVTACFDCNSGKSDKQLSDDSAVKKQMRQLKQNEERTEQIKMIAEWAKSESYQQEMWEINEASFRLCGIYMEHSQEKIVRSLIKKHGFKVVINSVYKSHEKYGDELFNYIGKVVSYLNATPEDREFMYCIGIARNLFPDYNKHKSAMLLSEAKERGLKSDQFRKIVNWASTFDEYVFLLESYPKYGDM